jgi:hypothetical protein
VIDDLLGSLQFHYPPGPAWRALVPLVALGWALGFGCGVPLALRRFGSWTEPHLRSAAVLIWFATLPSIVATTEYVVRAFTGATGSGWSLVTLFPLFCANLAAPFVALGSYYVRGVTKGPASFQVVRGVYAAAALAACGLWWRATWLAVISA